ncbi:MAG: hypothetical protein HY043_15900 [Verrucomicrobia bacterium]|nr:hypothetical protein [Verrucomicrobiota bacterium]
MKNPHHDSSRQASPGNSRSRPLLTATWLFMMGANLASLLGTGELQAMCIRRANFHAAQLNSPFGERVTIQSVAGYPDLPGTNDGPGLVARFNGLAGIATDAFGNIYVADSGNHVIRKIDARGIVTTLAGEPGTPGYLDATASQARFRNPRSVAVDASGNLFVADAENYVIRKISPAGVVNTFAGKSGKSGFKDGSASEALFSWPSGLAVDASGNIYATDSVTIRKISPPGTVSTLAGKPDNWGYRDGPGSEAAFRIPIGLAVDTSGNVYVADSGNDVIRKISPDGLVTTLPGQTPHPNGISVQNIQPASLRPQGGSFQGPTGVAVDSQGNVYAADVNTHVIYRITSDGRKTTFAGAVRQMYSSPEFADGPGPFAAFGNPYALTMDRSGQLLIVDSRNHTIQRGIFEAERVPKILVHPASQILKAGSNLTLKVAAQSAASLAYQWLVNGTIIPGATNSTLFIEKPGKTDEGEYRVAVSTGFDYTLSRPATVQIEIEVKTDHPLDSWHPVSRLPVKNFHAAYGNGRYVLVGESGALATSTDGVEWTRQPAIASENLNGVSFGNGTFVAVGQRATILTSSDGLAWNPQLLGASGIPNLQGVTFAQGIFVVVSGDRNGSIWTSADGAIWTNRLLEFDISLMAIAHSDDKFFAVGNTILTSPNGIDWEAASVSPKISDRSVLLTQAAFGGGVFLSCDGGPADCGDVHRNVLVSPTGQDWFELSPTNQFFFSGVAYGNGQFVAVDTDSGGVMSSTNGFDWSAHQLLSDDEQNVWRLNELAFVNGLFLAGADAGNIFVSTDAKTWTRRQQKPVLRIRPTAWFHLNGISFATAYQGIQSSNDGVDWKIHLPTNYLRGVAYGNGLHVAVGERDTIFTSPDGGTNWIDRRPQFKNDTAATHSLSQVAYGIGHFVAVGTVNFTNNVLSKPHILTSPDGMSWQIADTAGLNLTGYSSGVGDIAFGNGLFVAIGFWQHPMFGNYAGRIFTSTNSSTWQVAGEYVGVQLNTLAYGEGKFVIATEDIHTSIGAMLTSPDGIAWSRSVVPNIGSVGKVVFGNGLFLASASGGTFYSRDGVSWTPRADSPHFEAVGVGNGVFFGWNASYPGRSVDDTLYQSGPIERLSDPHRLASGQLEWTVNGAPHANYRIEFTEDFVTWQTLITVTDADAAKTFTDSEAANHRNRFYRVVAFQAKNQTDGLRSTLPLDTKECAVRRLVEPSSQPV